MKRTLEKTLDICLQSRESTKVDLSGILTSAIKDGPFLESFLLLCQESIAPAIPRGPSSFRGSFIISIDFFPNMRAASRRNIGIFVRESGDRHLSE